MGLGERDCAQHDDMIGVGPFITMPACFERHGRTAGHAGMGGGALLAVCDGWGRPNICSARRLIRSYSA